MLVEAQAVLLVPVGETGDLPEEVYYKVNESDVGLCRH